jgi:uncharacterized membrane protein YdjX (TVP38/TMEM64 family)
VAVAAIAWIGGRSLAPRLVALVADPDRVGPWAPLVFILSYAGGVIALIPATPFSLAAGAIFGIVHGAAYSFVGATIGSTCAFLLGRHGARRLVEVRLARMPRFAAVERAAAAKGRRIVFLLRLSPVVPFNFLNYALGLTTMSVWDFIVAGTGSIPGEVLYAYWGRISGEALALAEQAGAPKSASYYGFLVVGLIATAAATAVVTATARRALRDV